MNHYQASELKDSALNLATPFMVSISPGDELPPWRCNTILRHLPGKRLVLELERDSQRVLCKLFFQGRDYQRELRGYRHLRRGAVNTPGMLEHYHLAAGNYRVILYQFIAGPTLEQLNQEHALDETSPALLKTVAVAAAMHKVGLRQIDIHPGNYLYYQGEIQLVDTAAVRRHSAPLPGKLALHNLADLLAQFFPGQIHGLEPIWQAYCRAHPQPGWQPDQLPAAIDKMRRLRWRHYRRKLSRNCSDFIFHQDSTRLQVWLRNSDSPDMQALLERPDEAMEAGEYLKRGNTATVARSNLDGAFIAVKRYNIKHWRHRLSRCWRPTRAWRSWHNAHYLLFNGLQTPRPLALIEERCGPLRGRGFYICDFVEGDDLKSALIEADSSCRSELIRQFAEILRRYYRSGISHGDMKADNFIVTDTGVTIIDLDPMKHHRRHGPLVHHLQRDIRRFLANFDEAEAGDIKRQLFPLLPEALRS